MKFFFNRKRRKFIAELKNRRHAEDDLLSPALRCEMDSLIADLEACPEESESFEKLQKRAGSLQAAFPEKRGWMYAFLDLILVVGAVAFGLRGLYFQPFRIPTGSMQPTLYGIHYMSRENSSNKFLDKIPSPLNKLLFGMCDATVAAPEDTRFIPVSTMGKESGLIFDRATFQFGKYTVSLPGTPEQVHAYAGLDTERSFKRGELISNGYVSLGDHLFVERFSLYLSPPARGDVMVFTTENLFCDGRPLALSGGYYYIKRLAALPGDVVKIVNDQLYIKPGGKGEFRKIQDIEKRFEKIYSGKGGYHGHLANMGRISFAFGEEFTIPEDHYLMLGDNSKSSLDSRYFGTVHRRQMIGRAWITFYPFSRRTGLVDRMPPLDVPTTDKTMYLQ